MSITSQRHSLPVRFRSQVYLDLMGGPDTGSRLDPMGGPDAGARVDLMGESHLAFVDGLFSPRNSLG
jgi:hypothetical protein